MSQRLKVLYLPKRNDPRGLDPWRSDVFTAIGGEHDVSLFDHDKPLAAQFEDVDVVIDLGGSVGTRAMVDAAASARLWQILGTGLDHFDLDYWQAKGMPVANCPGPFSAVALAECCMLFILMLARKFPITQHNLRVGRFYEPLGLELDGLKLGLVGFGASGRELARRARPFGFQLSAIDVRDVSASEVDEFGLRFVGKPDALDAMLADVDIVSLHLHLNRETRHIIDARRLALMKPTAFLINVARGALVDEAALAEALLAGRLGGAGLDVFGQEPPDISQPIFQLPNVIATPHISGVTNGTSRKRAGCAAENVRRIAAGLEPLYRVA